ncbi:hypothetical protein BO70DRAFT_192222 [Aspergillus heteromorphus CBS 117.55]|uniref:Oxidoreductase-like domain-containing protein n=1 Tax=Aspergillus heteromorphus CBS 117.55 TaxID=1448321 RepID=A0A317UTQ6_9EURO|nr:uncharacterized protein BO70DRAFT_192222 [Aspergillus heteromorphus CBS 117.55]PWY64749.1 hypothetical protein BO70DRAFT_192222 [Aspergillus heteromorphus CBS 117.55]
MERPCMAIRPSLLFRRWLCHSLNFRVPSPSLLVRPQLISPHARRTHAHEYATLHDENAGGADSRAPQAHPLSGYYHDILSTRSPYGDPVKPTHQPEQPTQPAPPEPQTPQDKMSIVFGTRLAGPGRTSRYNPGSTPDAVWKTINGVAIPPRPEEPDNCCMSGCVHCVWDDYRDELEEWAARLDQAKTKPVTQSHATDLRHTPRAEVATASRSMEDDGGGSETNWSPPDSSEDLFANIPVGIREFMKTEKKLKQRHQEEGHT